MPARPSRDRSARRGRPTARRPRRSAARPSRSTPRERTCTTVPSKPASATTTFDPPARTSTGGSRRADRGDDLVLVARPRRTPRAGPPRRSVVSRRELHAERGYAARARDDRGRSSRARQRVLRGGSESRVTRAASGSGPAESSATDRGRRRVLPEPEGEVSERALHGRDTAPGRPARRHRAVPILRSSRRMTPLVDRARWSACARGRRAVISRSASARSSLRVLVEVAEARRPARRRRCAACTQRRSMMPEQPVAVGGVDRPGLEALVGDRAAAAARTSSRDRHLAERRASRPARRARRARRRGSSPRPREKDIADHTGRSSVARARATSP